MCPAWPSYRGSFEFRRPAPARAVRRSVSLCQWYVGGAGAVTVDDRGEPLHVRPEHRREGVALGLTEFLELLGDMRHRAVVLTKLYTVHPAVHTGGGRSVTGFRQCLGDTLGRRLDVT